MQLSVTAALALVLTLTVVRGTANRARGSAQAATLSSSDHAPSKETT